MPRSILLILVAVLAGLCAKTQQAPPGSNLRQKILAVAADTLHLDTLSIIPETFTIDQIDTAAYRLDYANAVLYWHKKPAVPRVRVTYRVFPFRLTTVLQRMQFDSVRNKLAVTPYAFHPESPGEQTGIFNFGTLRAEGSFGRQLSFGNSQDAVLNSTLNLQLSGLLGDSIEIAAAITDNNIPIQPDGTTQQLNEFDQVYLQFKKRNWQLNLGDIDIRQNQSYFLNFYKRLQGISFQTANRLGNAYSRTLASGSIAKGKFTRNIFQGLEGNQGPYRLTGAGNEFYFIVLANTERVFVDGQLLQRGEDQDYVINYNTAEITFTPRRMITKDSRIQVEFEYADRNYLNANFYLSQEVDVGQRLKLRLGVFTNSDAKHSPVNQVLSGEQKQFLAQLGDSVHRAYYPSAVPDTFAAGKVLYEKVYYNPGSGLDSFYRYSTDPLLAKYSLSFALVGEGNGHYVADFNGANGKVYRFTAPVNGLLQGNYEPVTVLVAPRKQQLVSLGIDYAAGKNTTIKAEAAMSNSDVNTFSKIGNGDDKGVAIKFKADNNKLLQTSHNLQLNTFVDYEFVQDKFRPLERLRTVEFSRDWGLPLFVAPATETIIRAGAGLSGTKSTLHYRLTSYTRGDDYKGIQHAISHIAGWKGWQLNNELLITRFTTLTGKGAFLRPTIDLSKRLTQWKNWRLGFRYAMEKNAVRSTTSDTLTAAAFFFDSYSVYLKSDETKKNRYGLSFFTRSDQYTQPAGKNFTPGDRSYNLNLQAELLADPRRQFYLNATFRKLDVNNTALSRQQEDETILGRAEYVMNEWKGLLTGNVLYEIGAGQEQRRDLAYIEVPAGTGQYAWIDYNSDQVQQLNEFELAAFPDQAKFIRIFTPTNEFTKANYVTLNYSLRLSPRALLNKAGLQGIQSALARLNLQTSMQISKKSVADGNFDFNPFPYNVRDTALITLNTSLLNMLSFNRFSNTWGIDLSNLRNRGKALLTYGQESRSSNHWEIGLRWNMAPSFQLNLNGRKGNRSLFTANPQFDNRNYELTVHSLEPVLTYIRGTSLRMVAGYQYEHKKNGPVYGGETAGLHSVTLESKYTVLQNSAISGRLIYNRIRFHAADPSVISTVSYIMLDGLFPGSNYLWSVTFTRRLLNNLELNVQYDGRRPAGSRTVHTGRAALTALF
ncbi:MAG: hypothetical protein ABW019_06160 [Chitinophagaceae bacterium]